MRVLLYCRRCKNAVLLLTVQEAAVKSRHLTTLTAELSRQRRSAPTTGNRIEAQKFFRPGLSIDKIPRKSDVDPDNRDRKTQKNSLSIDIGQLLSIDN